MEFVMKTDNQKVEGLGVHVQSIICAMYHIC